MRALLLATSIICLGPTGAVHGSLKLDLSGVTDPSLRQAIGSSFDLKTSDLVWLDEAEDQERQLSRLTQLMHSLGYIDGQIKRYEKADELRLSPEPGNLYNLGYVAVEGIPPSNPAQFQAKLRLHTERYVGQVVRSDILSDIGRKIMRVFEESGYPAAKIQNVELRKHPLARMVGLHLAVEAGERARFGNIVFTEAGAIEEFGPVDQFDGLAYHPAVIEALHEQIERSGRFRRVSLSVQPRPDEPDVVDIFAELKRKSQSEEELASHGRIGFGILAACCAMLAIRQTFSPIVRRGRRSVSVLADAVIAVALLLGAAFAIGRVHFMIG
jgi:outer membrane protein assembly factor BamA